jgi:hypothetical protein
MRECRWASGITQGTIAANKTTDGRHPHKHCRASANIRSAASTTNRAVCVSRLNADLLPGAEPAPGACTRRADPTWTWVVKFCAVCKRDRPTGFPSPMLQFSPGSVETKASWAVASVALFILGMSFGAAWITAVALKDIASEVGGRVPFQRSPARWRGSAPASAASSCHESPIGSARAGR